MDCSVPVDDFCDVWQSNNLEIPENIPIDHVNENSLFYIRIELEKTCPLIEEEEDEENEIDQLLEVTQTDSYTFWRSCPRIESENLDKKVISHILTEVGIPSHKQEFMVDRISMEADRIVNTYSGIEGTEILKMQVFISIVSCCCVV